ncbi:MAG TPA: sigma-54-dependent Fis family transcriptional regulator, partial [Eubacteriaceae bacterium]|nr:sigma-54-dependent Fis family transcriptional regulator [Eubacteriaceae bacterium]
MLVQKQRQVQKKEYIAASHRRCRDYGVEVDRKISKKIISEQQLFERLERKRELIITASPFMNQLYDFVKGSNFFAILTDETGCILNMIGDEEILSEAFSIKMTPGAYMDERNIGTNAMGTTLVEKKPLQVSGDEHYIQVYHRWTCSASPIHDRKGKVIGILDLTGYSESVHSHTLGMVVAAANAIEKIMVADAYAKDLAQEKNHHEAVLNSIMAGIVTCDLNGKILSANKWALQMTGFTENEIRSMPMERLFTDWAKIKNMVLPEGKITDYDTPVAPKTNKQEFTINVYPIEDLNGKIDRLIFTFREEQRGRKLSNKIMGRRAIYTFDKIIGRDRNFLRIIEFSKKIADSRSNVLITGESGTGKELFAQSIHNQSPRKGESFVAINCGAIPPSLIESELFGYEEGAFTGAKSSGQAGKFEIADKGTIFLDEIGEMPYDLQTRLLRVIEEGTVSRVGGLKETVVDVRIIAATNKNLEEEVEKGRFRKDLYFRLKVLPVHIPPLRERKRDIPLLIEYFMHRIAKKLNKKEVAIAGDYMDRLLGYD